MCVPLLIIIQSNMITKHILSNHSVSKLLCSFLSCSDCNVFLVDRLAHFVANGDADFVVYVTNGAADLVVNILHKIKSNSKLIQL